MGASGQTCGKLSVVVSAEASENRGGMRRKETNGAPEGGGVGGTVSRTRRRAGA